MIIFIFDIFNLSLSLAKVLFQKYALFFRNDYVADAKQIPWDFEQNKSNSGCTLYFPSLQDRLYYQKHQNTNLRQPISICLSTLKATALNGNYSPFALCCKNFGFISTSNPRLCSFPSSGTGSKRSFLFPWKKSPTAFSKPTYTKVRFLMVKSPKTKFHPQLHAYGSSFYLKTDIICTDGTCHEVYMNFICKVWTISPFLPQEKERHKKHSYLTQHAFLAEL